MTSSEDWTFDEETVSVGPSDPAIVISDRYTIVYVTDSFAERVDRPRAELVGADCAAVVDVLTSDATELQTAVEAVLNGDQNHERIEVAFVADESAPWAERPLREAQVTPVLDEGKLRGALVVFRGEETASERLAEANEHYRTLVERNRDGITITQDGKNVFVNNRFVEMVGYSKSELVGESFLLPVAPEDREILEQRHRQRTSGESPPRQYELTLQTKSGETLTVEINVATIQYGGDPAVMAAYRDITERKRREEELRRFRRVIETAPHAIALADEEQTITYVNPAFEDITGYSREEALGQTPDLFHSEKTPDSLHEEMWETISSGEVWQGYLLNERASGDLYHAQETVAPIETDGDERYGFVGIHTDISQRVERERLVDTLDRVLRHNLRNRLNVIQAHGNLIRRATDDDIDDHVDKICDSTDDLLETTRKGRDIITFLSHPPQKRPRDAVRTVRTAVNTVNEAEADADITLDTPQSAYVSAVPEFDTAIEELVRNAIEHNNRPRPSVSITVRTDEDHVELRIADDGPGISKMEQEILNETRDIDQLYHGSGFGLWLVYWIIRQSDGEITISDRTPRGTIITIELERITSPNVETVAETTFSTRTKQ